MGDYSPVLHIDNMSPKMILVLTLVFLIGGALSSALPSANPTDKNTEHVKNEDAENAGCKCIIEGSLVCHQIGTCFVECDSPCLDTEQIVFAGKNQCRSVSACKATKFEIVEPINHYLQNAVHVGVEHEEHGGVKTKNTEHLENEDVESLEFELNKEYEDNDDEDNEDEENKDNKDEENELNDAEVVESTASITTTCITSTDEEHEESTTSKSATSSNTKSTTSTSTTESTTSTTKSTKSTNEFTTITTAKSTTSTTIGLPAGCKCIIEGSLVCHQIKTCFVECDSPCLDTKHVVFAGKRQCQSVSACAATKFEIVEPINHYLLG